MYTVYTQFGSIVENGDSVPVGCGLCGLFKCGRTMKGQDTALTQALLDKIVTN